MRFGVGFGRSCGEPVLMGAKMVAGGVNREMRYSEWPHICESAIPPREL